MYKSGSSELRNYSMIDLFSGAGGLSLGLGEAGFEPVFAMDIDKYACQTYQQNIGEIVQGEISEKTIDLIYSRTKIQPGSLALVCGGPPCQGFSIQRRGVREDKRNDLVLTFARIATQLLPKVILLENVPGLLGVRGRSEYKALTALLDRAGYLFRARTLDAADFGVPQHRIRAFVVAWREDVVTNYEFPVPTYNKGTWRTVLEAIGDLPEPPNDYTEHTDYANHIRVRISALNEERIAYVPEGGGRIDIPANLQLPCHRKDNGHRHLDVYGRLEWDRPAGTITAMFDNFTRGRFAHPTKNRSITAREGARLQSFPDSFRFCGPKKDVARQIGNAVPPALAKHVGESIIAALEGTNGKLQFQEPELPFEVMQLT